MDAPQYVTALPVSSGAVPPAHLGDAVNLPPPDLELLAVWHDADVVVAAGDEADGELHVALGVAAVVVPPRRLPGEYLLQPGGVPVQAALPALAPARRAVVPGAGRVHHAPRVGTIH